MKALKQKPKKSFFSFLSPKTRKKPTSTPTAPAPESITSLRKKHKQLMESTESKMIKNAMSNLEESERKRSKIRSKKRLNRLSKKTNPLSHQNSTTQIKAELKQIESKLIKMITRVSAKHNKVASELRQKSIIKNIDQAPPGIPI